MSLIKFQVLLAILLALTLGPLLSGCITLPSREVMPPLPEALIRECPELATASSDTLAEILRTHAVNMGAARSCKDMHDALVKRVRELQK